MKLNRKGFTLVEILAVLVILTVVMGITVPSLSSSLERSKSKQISAKKEMLKTYAELYISDRKKAINQTEGDKCYIEISSLISEGYISQDDIDSDIEGLMDKYYLYNKSDNSYELKSKGEIDEKINSCSETKEIKDNFKNQIYEGSYIEMQFDQDTIKFNEAVGHGGTIYGTGSDEEFLFKPSELNPWIVLKRTGDYAYVTSVNATESKIKFCGKEGYKNITGVLNYLAKKFKNDYVVGNSYGSSDNHELGYAHSDADNNRDHKQTNYINSNLTQESTCTYNTNTEKYGNGDYYPSGDGNDKIKSTYVGFLYKLYILGGNTKKYIKTENEKSYWIPSRKCKKDEGYKGIYVDDDGEIRNFTFYNPSDTKQDCRSFGIRPVLKIKINMEKPKGSGKHNNPFVLEKKEVE